MTSTPKLLLATAVAAAAFAGSAGAQVGIGQIQIPGANLTSFDITYVDQASQRIFLADRSNKGIDIFDAKTEKFIGRVAGMVGLRMKDGKPSNEISGPNGVLAFGDEAWVGDGDSQVRVVDLKAMKIADTINTGGKARADELDYDPKDGVILIANGDEDEAPFVTLISTKPGHKIIAKLEFPQATDGIEQPAWNPADDLFYVALPELNNDGFRGGIAVIDPTGKLIKILPTSGCHGNGLVFGPNQHLFYGCTAHGKEGMESKQNVYDTSGNLIAEIPGVGGSDEVAYSKTNGQYYSGSSNSASGHVLGVFDANTNKLVTAIPIRGNAPHSVAVNEANGHIYMPAGAKEGGCGCILVFGGPL
jgi:DNA-binding beta-propeller fold protein YncE